jgi:hypothetical protein
MKKLTEKEILDELKRLGITSSSDIKNFLKEYRSYITSQNILLEQLEPVDSQVVD